MTTETRPAGVTRLVEYYKYFKLVSSLHLRSKKELIDMLLQEKARLHFLMLENAKVETGRIATTVSIIDKDTKILNRYYSIRRGIDELAHTVLGDKWVRRMIVHGIMQEFEDPSDSLFDVTLKKEVIHAQE